MRTRLQQERRSPMDALLDRIGTLRPGMHYVFGKFLREHITEMILVALGRLPFTQGLLNVEHLSPTNPIRIHAYTEDGMLVEIPDRTKSQHLLELEAYRAALRPIGQPGRPRKSPEAP